MKIDEISLLGLLASIWLALGLQLVLFLQPGSPEPSQNEGKHMKIDETQ